MATPTPGSFAAAHGAHILAGRSAALPAWAVGAPLNGWLEIKAADGSWNTAGAGGAHLDSFSGLAQRGTELWSHLAAGHGDGNDNRSSMIDLAANAPGWVVRRASTVNGETSGTGVYIPYYYDGSPAARHTYSSLHWVAQRNRFMSFALYGYWSNGDNGPYVDGFNPDTNTWDPAGTWPSVTGGYVGAVSLPNGDVWSTGGFTAKRWNQATNDYTVFSLTQYLRTPICYDSLRGHLFGLEYGDGNGNNGNLGVLACKINPTTGVQTIVTFNPSAGLTAFQNEPIVGNQTAPLMYSAMEYDPINDKYLFYCGMSNPGRVYAVTPSSGNTYDIAVHPTGAGATVPITPGSGLNNRFRYVAALKGFVLAPSQSSNLFFLRTA